MLQDDPGWPISWRTLLWVLVPRVGLRRQLARSEMGQVDGLVMLRQVFLSFWFAIVGFGVVIAVMYSGSRPPAHPQTKVAIGLLVFAAAALLVELRAERPLACEDDTRLAASYRRRLFLRIAFSEIAALGGFVGFFLTYAWWPYPIGAAVTAIGFRRAAPTSARLAGDQRELDLQGCRRSLIAALRQSPPPEESRS